MAFIFFLGVLALLLVIFAGYFITIYNGLVSLRNNIDRAWSNIDVLLKQRFDELPKLIKVCEGYMQHEQKTLEAVIKARSMVQSARGTQQKLEAQNMLSGHAEVPLHGGGTLPRPQGRRRISKPRQSHLGDRRPDR